MPQPSPYLSCYQDEQHGTFLDGNQPCPTRRSSSRVGSLTRGRPCGSPAARSKRSMASQCAAVTSFGWREASQSASLSAPASPKSASPEEFLAAARSAIRVSTVSWESFLLVPITPVGPRLIQPTTYSLRLPATRPLVLGMVPLLSSNGSPGAGRLA